MLCTCFSSSFSCLLACYDSEASAKNDSVESLFSACDHAQACENPSDLEKELLRASLGAMQKQLCSDVARDHFVEYQGTKRIMQLLESYKEEDYTNLLLHVAAEATKEQEEAKCGFMSYQFIIIIF